MRAFIPKFSGFNASVIVKKVKKLSEFFGYNAALKNEFEKNDF